MSFNHNKFCCPSMPLLWTILPCYFRRYIIPFGDGSYNLLSCYIFIVHIDRCLNRYKTRYKRWKVFWTVFQYERYTTRNPTCKCWLKSLITNFTFALSRFWLRVFTSTWWGLRGRVSIGLPLIPVYLYIIKNYARFSSLPSRKGSESQNTVLNTGIPV